ncbi:hypothetical protein [Acidicapsa ligni]|uniref:hypothetical protein n=1 Tax=Acidicapsa ligni TaxID=542300 RepID=UPI0021E036BD|nr:hypothetical protein [Acidicapsa ligni]
MKTKFLWKTALAATCLMLCSYAAVAQDGPPPPDAGASQGAAAQGESRHGDRMPDPDRQLKALTRILTLTTDQQTGVKALLDQQSAQMKALRNQPPTEQSANPGADPRHARIEQMERIREETSTKIAALLDDNQKKLFADWQAKRKAEMEQRRGRSQDVPPQPQPGDGPQ